MEEKAKKVLGFTLTLTPHRRESGSPRSQTDDGNARAKNSETS